MPEDTMSGAMEFATRHSPLPDGCPSGKASVDTLERIAYFTAECSNYSNDYSRNERHQKPVFNRRCSFFLFKKAH